MLDRVGVRPRPAVARAVLVGVGVGLRALAVGVGAALCNHRGTVANLVGQDIAAGVGHRRHHARGDRVRRHDRTCTFHGAGARAARYGYVVGNVQRDLLRHRRRLAAGAAVRHRVGSLERLRAVAGRRAVGVAHGKGTAVVCDTRARALQGRLQRRNRRVGRGVSRRTARHRQGGQRACDDHVRLRDFQGVVAGRGVVVRVRGADLHRLRAHLHDARHRGAPVLTVVCTILYINIVTADNTRGRRRRSQRAAVIDFRQLVAARTSQVDIGRRDRHLHRRALRPAHLVVVVIITALRCVNGRRVVAHVYTAHRLSAAVVELGRVETGGAARRSHSARIALRRTIIDLACVAAVHRDGHRGFRDRERAALHRDVVVRVAGRRRVHRYSVSAHVFTRSARHRVGRVNAVRRLVLHRGGVGSWVITVIVIHLRGIVGFDGDGSLVDGQRTGIISETVVAGIATDSRGAWHNLAAVRARVRLPTVQLDARQRLTGHQTAYLHLAGNVAGVGRIVLALRLTGVGIGLRLRGYSHCLGVDLQLAGSIGDVIVAGSAADGGRTRHDLAAIRARVRLTTVQRNARQCIAAHQTAYRHLAADVAGVRLVVFALRRTIVCVFLRFGRDGQILLVDRQLALVVNNIVVTCFAADSRRAWLYFVIIRACIRFKAIQLDTRQCITSHQTTHRHLVGNVAGVGLIVFALCRTVIGISLVLGSDGQRSLVHRYRSRRRRRTALTRIRDRHGVVVGTRSSRGTGDMTITGLVTHPARQPAGTDLAIRAGDHVDVNRLPVSDGRRQRSRAHRQLRQHRERVLAGGLHRGCTIADRTGERVIASLRGV